MPDSASSKKATRDEILRRLEANPRFRRVDSDPDEVSITFLGKEAADKARAAAEKTKP